ncbi:MAG: ribose 5-phosphate isomerase B [Proteobacteria bacterium]|nr:ribose 5-phosphate isomerase B [Pseudomonadota bacterium]
MKIAIGCDHGGFDLKQVIVPIVEQAGHTVVDLGCHTNESVDYPDFAALVCAAIGEGRCQRGILICGTGIGMSIAANRYRHIRAAMCHESFTARMSREHNDANVLCLGGRILGSALAQEVVTIWLTTEFAGGRHLRRIKMMG